MVRTAFALLSLAAAGVALGCSGVACSPDASSAPDASGSPDALGGLDARQEVSPRCEGPTEIARDLDPPAFSPAFGDERMASVAFNGTAHLVVWLTEEGGLAGQSNVVRATRVSASGVVLDPDGVGISGPVSRDGVVITAPDVASDGKDFLVVWAYDGWGAWDIYGARVEAATGALLDPGVFAISTAQGMQITPSVASNGSGYLVTWADARGPGIYGARVAATTGQVLEPDGFPIQHAQGAWRPRVASNGTDYLVACQSGQQPDNEVHSVRVGADGSVLDSQATLLATGESGRVDAASDGLDYLVAWQTDEGIRAARISSVSGEALDPGTIEVDTAQLWHSIRPRVHFGGDTYYVFWQNADLGWHAEYTRVDRASGQVLDVTATDVGLRLDKGDPVSVAGTGDAAYLVATGPLGSYDVAGSFDVVGATLDLSQTDDPLTDGPATIARTGSFQRVPTLASSAHGYVVAWIDQKNQPASGVDVYAALFHPDGTPSTTMVLPVSTRLGDQVQPDAAGQDDRYLLVWSDRQAETFTVRGVLLDAETGAMGTEFAISPHGEEAFSPSVAAAHGSFLVTWVGGSPDSVGHHALITAAGLEASVQARHTIAAEVDSPRVASDGSDYLVVWLDRGSSRLVAARAGGGDGRLLDVDPLLLDDSPYVASSGAYAVASAGSEYLVAWSRDMPVGPSELWGARVQPQTGERGSSFRMSWTNGYDYHPRLASDGASYLALWETNSEYPLWNVLGAKVTLGGGSASVESIGRLHENAYSPALAAFGEGEWMVTFSALAPELGTQRVHGALCR